MCRHPAYPCLWWASSLLHLPRVDHCTPRNAREKALARRLGFDPAIRLACQTTVTGDVTLRRLVLDDEDVAVTSQLSGGAIPGIVGQEQRLAILFADIRSFTPFAEAMLPYNVIHVLNRYFHHVVRRFVATAAPSTPTWAMG